MSERAFEGSSVRHGTLSGFRTHQNRGQDPCPACYAAKSDYDQRRASAGPRQISNRRNATAQGIASTRLRAIYPDVYRVLYEEAKREVALRESGAS